MRPRKKTRRDTAEIARDIVEQVTGSKLSGGELPAEQADSGECPKSDRGRKGGQSGGPARAAKLSARRRREIARKAARARWDKQNG